MRKGKKITANQVMSDPSVWLTMQQVAAVFKCGRNTLKRRLAEGKAKGLVPMDPFGTGKILILKKSLEEFIAKRVQETTKERTQAVHVHAA